MIICITNRLLCKDAFLKRIEYIAKAKPYAIILREKDLPSDEYEMLAMRCKEIVGKYDVPLIINSNIKVAENLSIDNLQMPVSLLLKHKDELEHFDWIGASVHSVEEAKQAENLGSTFIVAGHIFATECKKGVPPRGIGFLKEVCNAVSIPVFGIGGITKYNINQVMEAGAVGGCVMSEFMTCDLITETIKDFTLT